MNISFKNKDELFIRVRPALKAKETELIKKGYSFVKDTDIWNYLIQVKWTNSSNLMLSDIVNDILNSDNTGIVEYAKDRIEFTNIEY